MSDLLIYREIMGELFEIKKEKTAITNGNSKGASHISSLSDKEVEILDYGAGRLRNALYLFKEGFNNISLLDTKEQIKNWDKHKDKFKNIYSTEEIDFLNTKYDCILCSYVLNVIPSYEERVTVIKNINRLLNDNGIAVIEVRGYKALNGVKYKAPFNDGYICGNGKIRTFQKPYTMNDIIDFIHKESNLKITESKLNSDNLLLICNK